MNKKMTIGLLAAALLALLFPPYVRYAWTQSISLPDFPSAAPRRYESSVGWKFIGSFERNERIRWEILGLEVAALALCAVIGRRRGEDRMRSPSVAVATSAGIPRGASGPGEPVSRGGSAPGARSRNPWGNTSKAERVWAVALIWLMPLANACTKLSDGHAIALVAAVGTAMMGGVAWLIGVPVVRLVTGKYSSTETGQKEPPLERPCDKPPGAGAS